MRGPKDRQDRPTGILLDAGENGGGKVLERLRLFNAERGFRADTAVGLAPGAALPEAVPGDHYDVGAEYGAAARMLSEATNQRLRRAAETRMRQPAGAGAETDIAGASAGPAVATSQTAPAWRSIGPTRMDNGQTYGDTRISVSGRVSALAVDPGNSNHILCGSAAGGVWRSLDGGATWSPRTDFAPTLTIGAVAFDPSAPATIYVGTGEGNFYAHLGQGVLRSTDGGATFALLAAGAFVETGFFDLVVDPANSQRLFAATTHGLWLSTNGGVGWARQRARPTWAVSMAHPGGAGAELLAACDDGLFRSTNGTAWTRVNLPGGSPNYQRMAVDHARSDPAVAYVFASSGGVRKFWRRSGGTWQAFVPPADSTTEQDWYNWFLAAAPDRNNQVYIGGIEAWRGDLGTAGWSWTRISNKPGQDIHPDQHAIAIDPANPNVILIGNDGGLFRSPDRGQAWQSLNNGLAITEIEYIAQDCGSSRWLIGGTQDNGSIRYQGSSVWDHIADGDGGDCGVDRGNPSTVFHSYFGMGLERSTTRGDFGSFIDVGPNVAQGYEALFYPPVEVNGTTVAQAGSSIFLSRNSGTSWVERALQGGKATALYLATPDLAFAGTELGRLFRIRWNGSAWAAPQALTMPRTDAWISDLHVSADGNRIWATSSHIDGGRVFLSTDGGASWIDRSAGLPNLPVNAVEVDPANANRIWVAADLGVYQSLDRGATWSVFGTGLPNVLVADLLFHPNARLLRAGTRNRGVWEIPADGEMGQPVCAVQFTGTVPAGSTRRWVTGGWSPTWNVVWTVMPTSVLPGAPQLRWTVQVERSGVEQVAYWISVTNLTAQPVTFEGRYAILSRY